MLMILCAKTLLTSRPPTRPGAAFSLIPPLRPGRQRAPLPPRRARASIEPQQCKSKQMQIEISGNVTQIFFWDDSRCWSQHSKYVKYLSKWFNMSNPVLHIEERTTWWSTFKMPNTWILRNCLQYLYIPRQCQQQGTGSFSLSRGLDACHHFSAAKQARTKKDTNEKPRETKTANNRQKTLSHLFILPSALITNIQT